MTKRAFACAEWEQSITATNLVTAELAKAIQKAKAALPSLPEQHRQRPRHGTGADERAPCPYSRQTAEENTIVMNDVSRAGCHEPPRKTTTLTDLCKMDKEMKEKALATQTRCAHKTIYARYTKSSKYRRLLASGEVTNTALKNALTPFYFGNNLHYNITFSSSYYYFIPSLWRQYFSWI